MLKRIFFAVVLLLGISAPVGAEIGASGGAAPVLRFGVGARAFAMGGSYIAIVNDASAVYWNPAGLGELKSSQFTAMHSELYADTTYDYIGWGMPMGPGGFGINALNLATTGITNTEGTDTDAAIRVFYLGYGWKLAGWNIGVTGKYIFEDILGATGSSYSLDCGIQTKFTDNWLFGLMIQDITSKGIKWSTGYKEDIPVNYRVGLAYLRDPFLLITEVEQADDYFLRHVGFEYSINDYLKLRAGMRDNDFSTGIGIAKGSFEFDYAYCAGDLGNTNRLSLTVRF